MPHTRFSAGGLAVIAALAAAALTTVAPVSDAAPCAQYAFNGEFVARGYETYGKIGWTVTFASTGQFPAGPAQVRFDDGGTVDGTVNGGIRGDVIEFTIKWNDKPDNLWTFEGRVSGDGRVSGGEERRSHMAQGQARWDSLTPLVCYTPPSNNVAQPVTEAPTTGNTTLNPGPPLHGSDLAPTG